MPRTPRARPTAATPRPARSSLVLHAPPGIDPARARAFAWSAVAVAALLALVLAAIALGPHRVGDYFTETDFYGAYADGARAIQHGRLDPTRYGVIGPFYEIVLALAGFVVRDLLTAAELISVASATIVVLLWSRLLTARVDARLGLAAAAFLATNPTLIRYGYSATTDALALALQTVCLFVLLTRRGGRAAAAAGALAALAFLTRYNAIVLLPAGLIAILAGGAHFERRGAAALAFAAGFAAPVLPWLAYSLAHGGSFASQLHHNIAYDVFARGRGMTWDQYQRELEPQFRSLADVVARDPVAVVGRQFTNVFDHLARDASGLLRWPVAACAVAGLAFGLLDGTLRRSWPLLLAGALAFLVLVPAFHSERYSLAILPFYAALAGLAFASPRFALAVGASGPWLKAPLVVVPLALAGIEAGRAVSFTLQQLPVEVLDAAGALRARGGAGQPVIARKPHVAYHAGARALAFPFADSLPELAVAAQRRGARWLFYSWPEATLRPQFSFLLDTTVAVPGLARVYAAPGRPATLFEIGPRFGEVPDWMRNDTLLTLHRLLGRLRVDAANARTLFALGNLAAGRGDARGAVHWLERALARAPRDADGWRMLGESQLRLGDYRRAVQALSRAATLAPDDPRPAFGLGFALWKSGDAGAAARTWRPVVRRGADPGTLRLMLDLYTRFRDTTAVAEIRAELAAREGRP